MATGRDLMTSETAAAGAKDMPHLIPDERDYGYVEDERCRDVLEYIFARKEDGRFKRKIKHVS